MLSSSYPNGVTQAYAAVNVRIDGEAAGAGLAQDTHTRPHNPRRVRRRDRADSMASLCTSEELMFWGKIGGRRQKAVEGPASDPIERITGAGRMSSIILC
jgi:hypothetical protein